MTSSQTASVSSRKQRGCTRGDVDLDDAHRALVACGELHQRCRPAAASAHSPGREMPRDPTRRRCGCRRDAEPTATRSAFAVPAAGYRIDVGTRSGFDGSPMCHSCTPDSSTRAASNDSPSGAHQKPRWRPISSAATNSATPQLTPDSAISSRSFGPSLLTTRSVPLLAYAIVRPVGSSRGSKTGPPTASSRTVPPLSSLRAPTKSRPASVNAATPTCASVEIAHDAGGLFSSPFAARFLAGREVVVLRRQQRVRVGHQALDARRHVVAPQAGDPIGSASRSQEQHARAIG